MTIEIHIEPEWLALFALAIGDHDLTYGAQLGCDAGTRLLAPLTCLRAAAELADDDRELRLWPGGEPTPEGGASGQLHAEQHFEYLAPLRAGVRLAAMTSPGRTWSRPGRSGVLDFAETLTDFYAADGELVARSRKVGVRIRRPDPESTLPSAGAADAGRLEREAG